MSTATASPAQAFAPLLARVKALPQIALLIAAAAVIAVIVAFALWSRAPEYKVLFTNVSERDGGAIVAALNQMNVPYRFQDGSAALLVPADKVHETRLALAGQGLPRGGSVGFELLDDSKFGASQFTEQVNFQRALEGELARSIEAVQAVDKARVHLALPRQSLFVRNRQEPSASVLLNLYPGRALDDSQVAAIAHLVSSSVPELTVKNISIVDQYGRLLSAPGGEGRGMDASQFQRVRDVEQAYAQSIEAILTPLVGPGNVRAQVSAEMDFSRREETQETYRPNQEPGQAAVRSQQTSESQDNGALLPQGIPGALSNQPPVEPAAPIVNPPADAETTDTATTLPSHARRDATTNYELDRTILHKQHAVGTVARLSVAVIINHVADENGALQPLDPQHLEQLRKLVQEAMGYSAERGDSIELVHSAFARAPDITPQWWRDPYYIALAKSLGGWLLFGLVALWLWFGVLRPLLRKHLAEPQPAIPNINDTERREAAAAQAAEARARQQSRYDENLQMARDLAQKDPRSVAAILRTWMEQNEQ